MDWELFMVLVLVWFSIRVALGERAFLAILGFVVLYSIFGILPVVVVALVMEGCYWVCSFWRLFCWSDTRVEYHSG